MRPALGHARVLVQSFPDARFPYRDNMNTDIFGWDIGGAHLKVARLDASGNVTSVHQLACPLWRGVGELARSAAPLAGALEARDALHAVTMTGELCDVFPTRADGVRAILTAFAGLVGGDARTRVFAGHAGWLSPREAMSSGAGDVASANWLALATCVAECVGDGVLIDVGSTTTDVIPLGAGSVRAEGRDDATRLAAGELVYTGVVRTPVASVCTRVPFRGRWQPLAAETFATMADVHRLCGTLTERHDLMETADGGGKDASASARRLARMVGCDLADGAARGEMTLLAHYLARRQRETIADALALVMSRSGDAPAAAPLIGAGAGRFVVAALAAASGRSYRPFEQLVGVDAALDDDVAVAAPAVAAARLAWMARL